MAAFVPCPDNIVNCIVIGTVEIDQVEGGSDGAALRSSAPSLLLQCSYNLGIPLIPATKTTGRHGDFNGTARRGTANKFHLPLLGVGGGVQGGPLHVGAAGGALGGQVLGLVGVQLDAVKAAAQRLEVDVGIAVGGIDVAVPGGGVGVQHIPGVVHALDLLPGTQAGDGPLLVVAARVVPDVHVGSAADGGGRSHVQGPAAAGMRGNFVSCHIKYLLIIFYP